MMFAKGVLIGLVVIAAYLALFNYVLAMLFRHYPQFPKMIYAVSYLVRFALLGAVIYVFLMYRLGSAMGLLVGIVLGTVVYAHVRLKQLKAQVPQS